MNFAKFLQGAVVVSMLVYATACTNNKTEIKEDKYIVINPIQADSTYTQEYVADIKSTQFIELRAKANGFVEKVWVDEGKPVARGQLLFTLQSGEYGQEVFKAKAQLASAQAELQQANATVNVAETEIQQATVEFNNAKILADKNAISKSELELNKAKLVASKSKKQEALANIATANARIQEANASIKLASINRNYTEIRAPFSGVIGRILQKQGALITEGTLLTTLSDPNEMYAYFNVSESDYLNYVTKEEKNNRVQLKIANGKILPDYGYIETIDAEVNQSTGNISFRAKFKNPYHILKHGASGKVLIHNLLTNAILVPQQCTYEVQENLYVFIVSKDNTIQQRKIVPLMRLSNMYVLSEGLNPSDKVLYEGVQLVKDGDKISTVLKDYKDIIKPLKQ